jgi:hypothetical protein
MFDLYSQYKFKASDHVSTYFGFGFSSDGFKAVIGAKLVGIKVKIPFIIMSDAMPLDFTQVNESSDDSYKSVLKYGAVFGSFLLFNFGLAKITKKLEH